MKTSTRRDEAPLETTEAIRRAVEALGHHAPVPQILEYMRERFGIGATADAPTDPGAAPAPSAPAACDAPKAAGNRGKNRPND